MTALGGYWLGINKKKGKDKTLTQAWSKESDKI
jgi:hypothetical protein